MSRSHRVGGAEVSLQEYAHSLARFENSLSTLFFTEATEKRLRRKIKKMGQAGHVLIAYIDANIRALFNAAGPTPLTAKSEPVSVPRSLVGSALLTFLHFVRSPQADESSKKQPGKKYDFRIQIS